MATIANPESHANLPFKDVVTVPLDMADTVRILSCPTQVNDTVNWQGTRTFSTIESEIPAFATVATLSYSKYSSPVDMQGGVRKILGEYAFL